MRFIYLMLLLGITLNSYSNDRPKWITDLSSFKDCKSKSLCAVGMGESYNAAKRDARASISKIFTSKISSTYSSTLSEYGEEATESIQESTDSVLNGIEIIKSFEDDTETYVLAKLDKMKAANGFRDEIRKLDEQMQFLLNDKSLSSVGKLKEAYAKRQILNSRYTVLRGTGVADVVTYEQVFKSSKKLSKVVAQLTFDGKSKSLKAFMEEIITSMGIRLASKSSEGRTHYIHTVFDTEKLHLNIDGFEKYNFVFKIIAHNKDKVKTGVLSFTTAEVGRNYEHAYEKALPKVKEYIQENITKLNID